MEIAILQCFSVKQVKFVLLFALIMFEPKNQNDGLQVCGSSDVTNNQKVFPLLDL